MRSNLKEKGEQLLREEQVADDLRRTEKKRFDEADRIANDLRPEVFQPLLEEFRAAMESEKVFVNGVVRQDREGRDGAYQCSCFAMGTAPGNPYFVIGDQRR